MADTVLPDGRTRPSSISEFQKLSATVEAVRWDGGALNSGVSLEDLQRWGAPIQPTIFWGVKGHEHERTLYVGAYEDTEGDVHIAHVMQISDWIVRDSDGEFYVVPDDPFSARHERIKPTYNVAPSVPSDFDAEEWAEAMAHAYGGHAFAMPAVA